MPSTVLPCAFTCCAVRVDSAISAVLLTARIEEDGADDLRDALLLVVADKGGFVRWVGILRYLAIFAEGAGKGEYWGAWGVDTCIFGDLLVFPLERHPAVEAALPILTAQILLLRMAS